MLERPAAWPRFQSLRDPIALRAELQAFVKEQKLPEDTMPPAAALRDAGRHELLNAINQAGAQQCLLIALLHASFDAVSQPGTVACIMGNSACACLARSVLSRIQPHLWEAALI